MFSGVDLQSLLIVVSVDLTVVDESGVFAADNIDSVVNSIFSDVEFSLSANPVVVVVDFSVILSSLSISVSFESSPSDDIPVFT